MTNITDALKNLYVAFGGEAADVDTLSNITYVANAISALLGGDSNATNVTDAIENISAVVPSGGGGELDTLIDRTITSISNDTVTSIGNRAFYDCTALTTATFPNAISVGGEAFRGCESLESVDFGSVTRFSPSGNEFFNCTSLKTLIIRTPTIATYNNSGMFTNTPIARGTGYIYVPDDLVDGYKAASGWKSYANQYKPISELPTE